jgi:hypothetical protein
MNQLKKNLPLKIILLIAFSGMFVAYTAPTKHKYGDALVFLYWAVSFGWIFGCLRMWLRPNNEMVGAWSSVKNAFIEIFKWHPALFIQITLLLYLSVMDIESEKEVLHKILWGGLGYLAAFSFSARFGIFEAGRLSGMALVIAGSIHLFYMHWDMWMAYVDGRLAFDGGPRWGLLEGIKDIPRVGRKHLSFAMVNLIAGSLILSTLIPSKRLYFYFFTVVAAMTLVVVDARSAYVSIFAISLVVLLIRRRDIFSLVTDLRPSGMRLMTVLCLVMMLFILAYESGKSRWGFMAYSFSKAYEHVFNSTDPVAQRPYVDKQFWFTPVSNTFECYTNRELRCEADPSAYLRMAWLLDGVKQVGANPHGVGGSIDYMGRVWGVEGEDTKFQRVDSEFIMFSACYGVVGLIFYLIMLRSAMLLISRTSKISLDWVATFLSLIVLAILVRGAFDTISDGLWRCMMVLWGAATGIKYFSLKLNKPVEILISPHS